MQAPEYSDHVVKSVVDIVLRQSLESLALLFVAVESHVAWRQGLLIHEHHKRIITRLLEQDLVHERLLDHDIDLLLEIKQLLCELKWVFHVLLVAYEEGALLLNVWSHLFKDLIVF